MRVRVWAVEINKCNSQPRQSKSTDALYDFIFLYIYIYAVLDFKKFPQTRPTVLLSRRWLSPENSLYTFKMFVLYNLVKKEKNEMLCLPPPTQFSSIQIALLVKIKTEQNQYDY